MRILVICTLMATMIFTANSAEARHRRRCYNSYKHSHNHCGQVAYNHCGQPAYNQCGQTGACQPWNGQAYNVAAPVQYTGQVQYSVAAPVQTACLPAQPTTYSAAYPPSVDPNAGVTPMAPPAPQDVTTPPANGNAKSPPAPEPIDTESAPLPN